jgi:hypothetical protein
MNGVNLPGLRELQPAQRSEIHHSFAVTGLDVSAQGSGAERERHPAQQKQKQECECADTVADSDGEYYNAAGQARSPVEKSSERVDLEFFIAIDKAPQHESETPA